MTRRLFVVAVTVVASAALSAPAAHGQAVELTDEATSAHCPAVTLNGHAVSGGCVTHLVSEGDVYFEIHLFATVPLATCAMEATLHLDEDGGGYVAEPVLSGEDCDLEPCAEAGQAVPWPVQVEEIFLSPPLALNLSACFDGMGDISAIDFDCDVSLDVFENPSHVYEYVGVSELCSLGNPRIEVDAHLITEAGDQEFEILHL